MPKREKNEWVNQLIGVVRTIKLLSRIEGACNEELQEELRVISHVY
jgi:hypothetical protein